MKIVADENIRYVEEAFEGLGDVETMPGRQISSEHVVDAELLLVRSVTLVGPDLLEGSNVQFVGTATIGVDHIDRKYLDAHDIAFSSAAGSNANSVAEYVVSALLTLSRKGEFRLEDCSVGVVGVGNVGSRVVEKARALGMEPVLNDPPLRRKT
ncbi:MAG: 4-phosphoerythronate dehydrogenase, partial [Planctomycetota bacterium]